MSATSVSWQDLIAIALGLGAVAYLAWRWWPRPAGRPATPGACSHCDAGCRASACPPETPIRVIPPSPKP